MTSPTSSNDSRERRQGRLVDLARALENQRKQSQEFIKSHHQRVADAHARFAGETDIINSRLSDWDEFQQTFESRFREYKSEREALEQQRILFETRAQELNRQQIETEAQRQRVARKLDDRRRKMIADQSSSDARLQAEVLQLRGEVESLTTELQAVGSGSSTDKQALVECQRKLESLTEQFRKCESDLLVAQQETRRLEEALASSASALQTGGPAPGVTEETESLQRERDELAARIETLEAERDELADRATPEPLTGGEDHWREQYDMAMESVESLRDKNDRLEQELTDLRELSAQDRSRRGRNAASDDGGAQDWESQKRRMLASLEGSDFDDDEVQRVEDAIRATDEVVELKDAEIAELRAQLESRPSDQEILEAKTRSREIAEILNNDEIISAERERIEKLQQEWEARLRKSEVDCAKERAEIARMRSELAEKLRDVDGELANLGRGTAKDKGGRTKSGRRWLDHLGLGNNDSNAPKES